MDKCGREKHDIWNCICPVCWTDKHTFKTFRDYLVMQFHCMCCEGDYEIRKVE